MSAQWSITYLKSDISVEELFELVITAFLLEIDDRLYAKKSLGESVIDIKIGRAIVEKFTDPLRARIIVDSCQQEWYNRGVIVYPKKEGLFTLADTVIHIGNMYESGRSRRTELTKRITLKPDFFSNSLFLYINFLSRVTKVLNSQAVHVMFERNPAGRETGIHFYDSGRLIDDYYIENIECEGRYGLIELPQKPDVVKQILDGRFAFLTDQPRIKHYDFDKEYSREEYFDGEDLSPKESAWDVFNVNASHLYVPFWDEDSQPFGAIYCPKEELPQYFLARYQ